VAEMASPPKEMVPDRKMSGSSDPGSDGGRVRTASSSSTEGCQQRSRRFSLSEDSGRTVVVAIDASEDAKFAFEWFRENIYQKDDFIVLVHCPEAPRLPTLSFKSPIAPPIDEWKKIMDDSNAKTRVLEEDYEQVCIENKLKYKVYSDSQGKPGEVIVRIAEEVKAEVIVMGTRGLGKIRRAVLGSVSDYVVRNALLPVVIVPSITKRKKSLSGH